MKTFRVVSAGVPGHHDFVAKKIQGITSDIVVFLDDKDEQVAVVSLKNVTVVYEVQPPQKAR
jgi:hypothetical protein